MIFTEIEFLLFFALVLGVILRLPSLCGVKIGLLVASYLFYGWWDARFCLLLAASSTVHWWMGRLIASTDSPRRKKLAASVSIVGALLLLGYFKYVNFFIGSWNAAFGGILPLATVKVLLPVGISFFTFQAVSYVVDVYAGKVEGRRSWLDVSLYISFFPQILSGPIVRAGDFFPQLNRRAPVTGERLALGFGQFAMGFFKKAFIADRLATYVGSLFENCAVMDSASLVLGGIAYSVQIYCDFSGYSDMAIGVARAMGFDYRKNFDHPYSSTTITEFWRRWHISLSTWLRDYVYIPFGGNRKGVVRTYVNCIATMLIGGLWHGAAWTFVVWGGLHGVALAIHKFFLKRLSWLDGLKLWKPISWLLTMAVVVAGWIFFRAESFDQVSAYFSGIAACRGGLTWLHPFAFVAIACVAVGHLTAGVPVLQRWRNADVRTPYGLFLAVTLFALAVLYPADGANPFIYFQF